MLFLASCNGLNSNSAPSTTCTAQEAIIQVFDNGMKRACGCAEPGNQMFSNGSQFVCTVPVGTMIYVYYPGIANPHNVYITPLVTFPERYPNPTNPNQADGYLLNLSGTYTLGDSSLTTTGSLVVQ